MVEDALERARDGRHPFRSWFRHGIFGTAGETIPYADKVWRLKPKKCLPLFNVLLSRRIQVFVSVSDEFLVNLQCWSTDPPIFLMGQNYGRVHPAQASHNSMHLRSISPNHDVGAEADKRLASFRKPSELLSRYMLANRICLAGSIGILGIFQCLCCAR